MGRPARPLLPDPAVRHRRPARRRRHRPQPHEPLDARRLASRGTANTSRSASPASSRCSVVLAYDVRQFEDKRKQLQPRPAQPGPAPVVARTWPSTPPASTPPTASTPTSCRADSPRYLATPELSFAIRQLQAHGGLNISASHNPPDDNGGKFYDERGGQPVPPDDQIMADLVDQVTTIKHAALGRGGAQRQGPLPRRRAAPGLHRPVPQAEPGAAAASSTRSRSSSRRCTASARMTAMEVLVKPGLPRRARRGADDARRPVPQRHADAQPRGARVDGPGRGAGREQPAPTWCWPPTPTPTASAAMAPDRDGRLALRHRQRDRRPADALQAEPSWRSRAGCRASPIVVTTRGDDRPGHAHRPALRRQVVDNLLVGFKYIADVLWQLEQNGGYEDVQRHAGRLRHRLARRATASW